MLRDSIRGRPTFTVGALVLASLLSGAAGGEPAREAAAADRPNSIVLVGLDGFEWDVVLPLLGEGRLPHLASLMERGTYGELRTLKPTMSPVIWTSIATGYTAERHGIDGYTDTRFLDSRLLRSTDRRVKAFWNILGDYGRRVATVGWWMTWPAEPVNGVMVAQVNLVKPSKGMSKGTLIPGLENQVHPPELQKELLALVPEVSEGLDDIVRRIFGASAGPGLGPIPDRLWEESLWAIRADAIYRRVALELLGGEDRFDLLAVYFGGSDVIAHRYWRYMQADLYDTPPSQAEVASLGQFIRAYYVHIDSVIGELAAAAPGAAMVVVSDHGMHPIRTNADFRRSGSSRALISGGHPDAPASFFAAAGPGIRRSGELPEDRASLATLGSIFDVLPTLLALLELPVAKDFEGEVLRAAIDPVFFEAHPLRHVETHTPDDWFANRSEPPAGEFELEAQRIEQLQALGYLP